MDNGEVIATDKVVVVLSGKGELRIGIVLVNIRTVNNGVDTGRVLDDLKICLLYTSRCV